MALTPNERFIAACCKTTVCVSGTLKHVNVYLKTSQKSWWTDVAVSNDIVAAYSSDVLSRVVHFNRQSDCLHQ